MRVTRSHGLLWIGEDGKRWSVTDPDSDELEEAMHRLRYPPVPYTDDRWRADTYRVLRAAEDYQFLTSYTLGVTHVVGKLRAIWRARKS